VLLDFGTVSYCFLPPVRNGGKAGHRHAGLA